MTKNICFLKRFTSEGFCFISCVKLSAVIKDLFQIALRNVVRCNFSLDIRLLCLKRTEFSFYVLYSKLFLMMRAKR